MARVTKATAIDNQIQKKQEKLFSLKDQMDVLTAEIEELLKQKKEVQKAELLASLENSERTYEEILEFLKSAPKRTTTAAKAGKRKYTKRAQKAD